MLHFVIAIEFSLIVKICGFKKFMTESNVPNVQSFQERHRYAGGLSHFNYNP